jgi:hypothetical protein
MKTEMKLLELKDLKVGELYLLHKQEHEEYIFMYLDYVFEFFGHRASRYTITTLHGNMYYYPELEDICTLDED